MVVIKNKRVNFIKDNYLYMEEIYFIFIAYLLTESGIQKRASSSFEDLW